MPQPKTNDHEPVVSSLTAHLAALDLDPATLEILMAALTIDVSEHEDVARA